MKTQIKQSASYVEQLRSRIKDAAVQHDADRKQRLLDADAYLGTVVQKGADALQMNGSSLKQKTLEMNDAARRAVKSITEAVASERAGRK